MGAKDGRRGVLAPKKGGLAWGPEMWLSPDIVG